VGKVIVSDWEGQNPPPLQTVRFLIVAEGA
jgi:hypothetical protein